MITFEGNVIGAPANIEPGKLIISTYTFSEVAAKLCVDDIGRNRMMDILREAKVIDDNNMPNQKYVNDGLLKIRYRDTYFGQLPATTVIGNRGVRFIREVVIKHLKEGKYDKKKKLGRKSSYSGRCVL